MQRAAASSTRSPSASGNTPIRDGSSPPSAKRQKLTDSESSAPGTPVSPTPQSTDLRAMSAAVAAEEKSRSEARLRSAAEGGETEWVLILPGVNGSTNGNIRTENGNANRMQEAEEMEDDEIWQDRTVGRLSYGGFKRKKDQAGTTSLTKAGKEDDDGLSEVDISDLEMGASHLSTKRPLQADQNKAKAEEKRWQAMDRMNLKKQNYISGFSPKGALSDRTAKVNKKPRHSSTS
jgi:hypothetical protein